MNYEKKYKEALEKARQFSERPLEEDSSTIVEYIFPELAESEDERIRKELIGFLQLPHPQFVGERKQEKWIAWLEKQGEKKSSDEVLKIRQEVYQSGYNDGYKHGIEDGKQGEKKSIWNEKDDGYKLVALSAFLNYYDEENPLRKCLINWLKSLKQRMGG